MNSKERMLNTLSGKPADRIPVAPLAVHYCAKLAGVSLEEYTLNPSVLADSVLSYYERFRFDAVWISADTWVTAQAMGAPVKFSGANQPMTGTGDPIIKTIADIDKIPAVNIPSQGRFPVMLEALARVKESLKDDVFIVGCFDQSPFSLVCELMGFEKAMLNLINDQHVLNLLLDRCIEYCVAYGEAMALAGADMLSTGDSPAGLIGNELYRQVALPAEQQVFSKLRKKTDKFLSLHICGKTDHILADMADSGADILEIDSELDLELACQIVSSEITLWGNLNPVLLLEKGTPKTVEAEIDRIENTLKKYNRSRFVLSSGCTLTPDTKEENLVILLSRS